MVIWQVVSVSVHREKQSSSACVWVYSAPTLSGTLGHSFCSFVTTQLIRFQWMGVGWYSPPWLWPFELSTLQRSKCPICYFWVRIHLVIVPPDAEWVNSNGDIFVELDEQMKIYLWSWMKQWRYICGVGWTNEDTFLELDELIKICLWSWMKQWRYISGVGWSNGDIFVELDEAMEIYLWS